jgi:hypothetical protein
VRRTNAAGEAGLVDSIIIESDKLIIVFGTLIAANKISSGFMGEAE